MGFFVAKQANKINLNPTLEKISIFAFMILLFLPTLSINGESLGFFSSHPGLFALITTSCTGYILLFGLPIRFLDWKINSILEISGKYSYSIYLVHFPIIVLFLYRPFMGTILQPENTYELTLLIALIALFSLFSYHFIELPGRRLTFNKKYIAAPLSVLIITCLAYISPKFLYTSKELNIFAGWTDRGAYRCGKLFRVLHPSEVMCKITDNVLNPKGRVLLLGNSHADSTLLLNLLNVQIMMFILWLITRL